MAKQNSNGNSSPAGERPVAEEQPVRDCGSGVTADDWYFGALCKRNVPLLCLLLFSLIVWVYLPSLRNEFIEFDDSVYVVENGHVNSGLTLENIQWAFRNSEASNWHPVTWLSHMLDCQLYGLKPWGHHLTSVLLHGVNSVLVFLVFRGLTGALWRSLSVAALFGLHPLRVESVAWISERKDVLSTLFVLLTLWAYGRYAEGMTSDKWRVTGGGGITSPSVVSPVTRHSPHFYGLALVFFALGLMSKPMAVTIPCLLLLLDYWPLGRVLSPGPGVPSRKSGVSNASTLNPQPLTLNRLLLEKVPFFLLAAAVSTVTYFAQRNGGMMKEWAGLSLGDRIGNALISYTRYLGKLFWPVNLCAFYPHPGHWPEGRVLGAGLMVLGVTVLAVVVRRQRPYLLVGWLWYVGTLVPAIGLVQIGGQSMADRYVYVPLIGLFVVLVWGVCELAGSSRYWKIVLSASGVGVVLVCIGLTRHQIGYWRDGLTVWNRAIAVVERNYNAHNRLGRVLLRQERFDAAVSHFQEAVRLRPDFAEAHYSLAYILIRKGKVDETIVHLKKVVELQPEFAQAHNNLGVALATNGKLDEAIREFQKAVELNPGWAEASNNLAFALGRKEAPENPPAISAKP